jgi:hypothetical protein
MTTAEEPAPQWRRSSACLPTECVEVASHGGHVMVRDSADKSGFILRFENDQWRSFIAEIPSCLGLQAPVTE